MLIRIEMVNEQSLMQIALISPPSHQLLLKSYQREVSFQLENPCLVEQGILGKSHVGLVSTGSWRRFDEQCCFFLLAVEFCLLLDRRGFSVLQY